MNKPDMFHSVVVWATAMTMTFSSIFSAQPVQAQSMLLASGYSVGQSSPIMNLSLLRGLKVDPQDPFQLEFLMDGGAAQSPELISQESEKLIKYFLTSLTLPEEDLWVNLSPREPDRVIPAAFGQTAMGQDLLLQDYWLKQISSALMVPESETGRAFWSRIYESASQKGMTDIPQDVLSRVWIVPETGYFYEHGQTVVITDARLKVMTEREYLRRGTGSVPNDSGHMQRAPTHDADQVLGSQRSFDCMPGICIEEQQAFEDIIIPILEEEINEGETFAPLRQIYNAMLLSVWFKTRMKDHVLARVYTDARELSALTTEQGDAAIRQIWHAYVETYRTGAGEYVREEYDPVSQQTISRRYVTGGALPVTKDNAQFTATMPLRMDQLPNYRVPVSFMSADAAMLDKETGRHKPLERVDLGTGDRVELGGSGVGVPQKVGETYRRAQRDSRRGFRIKPIPFALLLGSLFILTVLLFNSPVFESSDNQDSYAYYGGSEGDYHEVQVVDAEGKTFSLPLYKGDSLLNQRPFHELEQEISGVFVRFSFFQGALRLYLALSIEDQMGHSADGYQQPFVRYILPSSQSKEDVYEWKDPEYLQVELPEAIAARMEREIRAELIRQRKEDEKKKGKQRTTDPKRFYEWKPETLVLMHELGLDPDHPDYALALKSVSESIVRNYLTRAGGKRMDHLNDVMVPKDVKEMMLRYESQLYPDLHAMRYLKDPVYEKVHFVLTLEWEEVNHRVHLEIYRKWGDKPSRPIESIYGDPGENPVWLEITKNVGITKDELWGIHSVTDFYGWLQSAVRNRRVARTDMIDELFQRLEGILYYEDLDSRKYRADDKSAWGEGDYGLSSRLRTKLMAEGVDFESEHIISKGFPVIHSNQRTILRVYRDQNVIVFKFYAYTPPQNFYDTGILKELDEIRLRKPANTDQEIL